MQPSCSTMFRAPPSYKDDDDVTPFIIDKDARLREGTHLLQGAQLRQGLGEVVRQGLGHPRMLPDALHADPLGLQGRMPGEGEWGGEGYKGGLGGTGCTMSFIQPCTHQSRGRATLIIVARIKAHPLPCALRLHPPPCTN